MISRADTLRASTPTARMPSASGRIAALSTQGRAGLSDSSRKITPPSAGRVRLALIRSNFHCLPLRLSSTSRLPFFRPSSRRSLPSKPVAPAPSIQAIRPVTSSNIRTQRTLRCVCIGLPEPAGASVRAGAPVTIGRLSAPAKIVTRPSVSIRTAISAPTRLRLCARTWPVSKPRPEIPTSALGALATTVPSASRTTMSRSRSEVRPVSSRSICVPPTTTVFLPPKFSSIAAFSQGVAISSSIGPLDSRHHRPSDMTVKIAMASADPQNR